LKNIVNLYKNLYNLLIIQQIHNCFWNLFKWLVRSKNSCNSTTMGISSSGSNSQITEFSTLASNDPRGLFFQNGPKLPKT